MRVSLARVPPALLGAATLAAAMPASADETTHTKRRLTDFIRQFTIGYERLPLSVGDATFRVEGLSSHTGKELGFSSPVAQVIDMRSEIQVVDEMFIVLDSEVGGWAKRDTTATDPYASHVRGDITVGGVAFGLGDALRLGGHLVVRGDVTLGVQLLGIPVSPRPSPRGGDVAVQFFVRPRVALEVPVDEIFALGAFVSDDAVRPRLVAFGGFIGISPW